MSVSIITDGNEHTRSGAKMMSIAYDYARESTLEVWLSKPKLLLIDGQHLASASGRTFKTLNPATGQLVATVVLMLANRFRAYCDRIFRPRSIR